ncbi:uncharacterized protein LOC117646710 [Thrips palmi]|uniref:Uncharacterized protein LOC117646710 n=1 Tax=Thrips palmi TaxID=161013 RepID=A0A6P8Z260_THRPL|nr:uncharacterized protein LOC117646710 [Thrips palmi]
MSTIMKTDPEPPRKRKPPKKVSKRRRIGRQLKRRRKNHDNHSGNRPQKQKKQKLISETVTTPEVPTSDLSSVLCDHDYVSEIPKSSATVETAPEGYRTRIKSETLKVTRPEESTDTKLQTLFLKVKRKLESVLPKYWMTMVDKTELHVMKVCLEKCAVIQRSLIVSESGVVDLYVYNQSFKAVPYGKYLGCPVPLSLKSINLFVNRIVAIVRNVDKMEVLGEFNNAQLSVFHFCLG